MEQVFSGISPYGEDKKFRFAGRHDETWALYDRIIRNESTVYYAASGEGKSSLIRAGLLPIIRRRNFFPVYIVFTDNELADVNKIDDCIFNRINEALGKSRDIKQEDSAWAQEHAEYKDKLEKYPWWRLRNIRFIRDDEELTPLFIFDQFEEVFTKASYEWTNKFFEWLERITTDYVPDKLREELKSVDKLREEPKSVDIPTQKNFRMLFSFRTEYLGDLDYWCAQKHFIPSLQENRMCLKAMTPAGAAEVIQLSSELAPYTQQIINGCTNSRTDISDNTQPCVYALILSVVCHKLSELSDDERNELLDKLNKDREKTINDILLRFYKGKLQEANLDFEKHEDIIKQLEDALVDESGRRCRRDTEDRNIKPLQGYIDKLSNNGLIKIIGKTEVDGIVIRTIEFPHDRLCKAINDARKERREKIVERMKRQGEWFQFCIISAVMALIAFMWNFLLSAIKPVIYGMMSSDDTTRESFVRYLHGKSTQGEPDLGEGFSALWLMTAMVILLPFITSFAARKGRKWHISTLSLSFAGVVCFGLLWRLNDRLNIGNMFINILTYINLAASVIMMIVSLFRLRKDVPKQESANDASPSWWPLAGGYFLFGCFVFYLSLFSLAIGVSNPQDSFWALAALPLLFLLWSWGFFRFSVDGKSKIRIMFVLLAAAALALAAIGFLPYVKPDTYTYALPISYILLAVYIAAVRPAIDMAGSDSKYYPPTKVSRTTAIGANTLVVLLTFFLHLGYNPLSISSRNIDNVYSWRTVDVRADSLIGTDREKEFGVVDAFSGDPIVPVCLRRFPGRSPRIISHFSENPIANGWLKIVDSSFSWRNGIASGEIPTAPTIEVYMRKLKKKKCKNLEDSVRYYAAHLFGELRWANINYMLTTQPYTLDSIKYIDSLVSLQKIALSKELGSLSDSIKIENSDTKRLLFSVLEDRHLTGFHRELSRSMLLCSLKDRIKQQDIPSVFSLVGLFYLAYFPNIECVTSNFSGSINMKVHIDESDGEWVEKFDLNSSQILAEKSYEWYNLFNSICISEAAFNAVTFQEWAQSISDKFSAQLSEKYINILKTPDTIKNLDNNSLQELLSKATTMLHSYSELLKLSNDEVETDINYNETETSFGEIKDTVLNCIIPKLKAHPSGMYNGDFENVCQKLIMVSALRGNDVTNNVNDLNAYMEIKNSAYYSISKLATGELLKEFIEKADKLIKEKTPIPDIDGFLEQLKQANEANRENERINRVIDSLLKINSNKKTE